MLSIRFGTKVVVAKAVVTKAIIVLRRSCVTGIVLRVLQRNCAGEGCTDKFTEQF